MRIKEIVIKEGNKQKYHYPLLESNGNQCVDVIEKRIATVKNPIWIKPRHQHWEKLHSFETVNSPGIAFDKTKEILYVVAADSLYQVSIKNGHLTGSPLSKSHGSLPAGNQSIADPATGKLYNFYIDKKKVSIYNTASRSWDVNFSSNTLTEFWQANKFISSFDSALYIIGGYGQLQYKNQVQRYSFASKKWESIQPKGDFFMPRYLAALGANTATDTAYIIGGYGSKTGDQTINPKYNYELMAYSVKTGSFKSIYHFKDPDKKFCFANSLVIDTATNDFYSLIYPIDRFNSSLQLIKGSLAKPVYELLGDSIPYSFHDIESFADLYYCPATKKLVAVTLLSTKTGLTHVNIYTLDFPPNTLIAAFQVENKRPPYWPYFLMGCFILIAVIFFIARNKRKTMQLASPPGAPVSPAIIRSANAVAEINPPVADYPAKTNEASAVFLFGQFEVFDKNGTDIARQFTPLVKELFLLMLIHTYKDGKGISSEHLYETLWSGKSLKDARNNYSVNIVKLKTILEKVGEIHIGKESGKWKLEILDDSILLDYRKFADLGPGKSAHDKNYINQLYNIVHRGSLLREVHYNWLDDIKSDVSGFVTDTLLRYIASVGLQDEAEFIVKLSSCIFYFDQLNEEALEYKCRCLVLLGRHGMAKETYVKFAKEYKENYGPNFERSFTEIVGHA